MDLLQQPYDFEMALSDDLREKRSLRRKVALESKFHDGRGRQAATQQLGYSRDLEVSIDFLKLWHGLLGPLFSISSFTTCQWTQMSVRCAATGTEA